MAQAQTGATPTTLPTLLQTWQLVAVPRQD